MTQHSLMYSVLVFGLLGLLILMLAGAAQWCLSRGMVSKISLRVHFHFKLL